MPNHRHKRRAHTTRSCGGRAIPTHHVGFRSLRASPSPLRKRSSAAHGRSLALSLTRDGCSSAPCHRFPSQLNPPSTAGSGHRRFQAGMQQARRRGQTTASPLPGPNLERSQTAACELRRKPPWHLSVPQVRRGADHRPSPAQTRASPCGAAGSRTSSFLQPREAAALNHLQRPARSCYAVLLFAQRSLKGRR